MALSVACSAPLVGAEAAAAHPLPASHTLLAGVVSSAGEFPSWNRAFDGRLRLRMVFQAWAFNADPTSVLDGPGIPVISWEPWRPPRLGTPIGRQGAPQRAYSNAAIADGRWDPYLRRWALAIKSYRRPVVLRPMAEFNGFWYPWSHDPHQFVRAWRHMWNVFHTVGADNVTWVWSFQVNSNAQPGPWEEKVEQYWPGRHYVDILGMSLLRFAQGNSVPFYLGQLDLAHELFHRPTMISEANVAYGLSIPWLTQLREGLSELPFNEGFVWSQAPSQQEARDPASGDMDWDARKDPAAASLLASIASLPR
ncbi:MAG TPA: glycosyl hydrolase [Solirubrobacteraceae bacterium]|nr:glycosyl hydrolase [Solirubrobacteraceae bacterium]